MGNKMNLKETILLFFKGFFMGLADIIPGVSGGTIALIVGVYERLITAIKNINPFTVRNLPGVFLGQKEPTKNFIADIKKIDFLFLAVLGGGILAAIVIGSKSIPYLMTSYPLYVYAFFSGLIIASIRIIVRRKLDKFTKQDLFVLLFGLISGLAIVSLPALQTTHNLLITFISGMVAICAMILPGISGSFILLILGQYEFMLKVLHNITGQFWHFLLFLAGAGVGLLGFSRFLSWLFRKYHDYVVMFLSGLMLGALKLPAEEMFKAGPVSGFSAALAFLTIVLGAAVVTTIGFISTRVK